MNRDFDWKEFARRTWAAPAIGLLWLLQAVINRDRTAMILAVVVGFCVGPLIGYVWVRMSTRRR